MFTTLLARLGFDAAAPIIKTFARPLAYLAAGLAVLLAVWLVTRWDERRIIKAERTGEERMDLKWKAELEKNNREIAQRQTEQAIAAGIASAKLVAEKEAAEARVTELEMANAELPNAARIGLSRARAGLLRQR